MSLKIPMTPSVTDPGTLRLIAQRLNQYATPGPTLDDLKDRRGYSHLKEEVLDRAMWRNRFGGGFGPVVRQNTE
jgi:hypothetical protein